MHDWVNVSWLCLVIMFPDATMHLNSQYVGLKKIFSRRGRDFSFGAETMFALLVTSTSCTLLYVRHSTFFEVEVAIIVTVDGVCLLATPVMCE